MTHPAWRVVSFIVCAIPKPFNMKPDYRQGAGSENAHAWVLFGRNPVSVLTLHWDQLSGFVISFKIYQTRILDIFVVKTNYMSNIQLTFRFILA